MAEKKAPSRRLAKPDGAAEKAPSRSNHMQNTQAPRKRQPLIRNDVIRCEKCGEDYSVTYKRCPFCDERPGRPGVGHSGRHPVQLVGLVISLAIIAAAVFIVFTYVSPLIFHNQGGTDPGGISSSQGDTSLTPIDGSSSSAQEEPTVPVNSITLSRTEFTLQANEPYPITATTDPADVAVVDARSRRLLSVSEVQTGKYTAWHYNHKVYECISFSEIVGLIEERYDVSVIYDPSSFDDTAYRLVVGNNELLGQMLDILNLIVPIEYTVQDRRVLIKRKR